MKGEAARCLEAGCDAYLSKPVDRGQLIETLVRLPKTKPAQKPLAERETPPQAVGAIDIPSMGPSAQPSLLIVDDDPDAAESFAALLEMEGYRVRTAHDGASAKREVEQMPFALIFLDLTFPGETGYDIFEAIKGSVARHGTMVVALSGRDSQEERARSQQAGFREHLTKPVSADRLLGVVKNLLSERSGRLAV